jgi:hypothetical protein
VSWAAAIWDNRHVRGSLSAAAAVLAAIGVGVGVQAGAWAPVTVAGGPSSLQLRPVLNVSVSVTRGGQIRTERVLPVQCPTTPPGSTTSTLPGWPPQDPPDGSGVVLASSLGCLELGPAQLSFSGLGSGVQVVPAAGGGYDVTFALSPAQRRAYSLVAVANYHHLVADVVLGRVVWLAVILSRVAGPSGEVQLQSLHLAEEVGAALAGSGPAGAASASASAASGSGSASSAASGSR